MFDTVAEEGCAATVPEVSAELLEVWAAEDAMLAEPPEPVEPALLALPVFDPTQLSIRACIAELLAIERQIAALHALQVRLLSRVAELRPDPTGDHVSEFAADEVAAELSWTRWQAARRLACAQDLTSRLPATLASLEAGQIDLATAEGLRQVTAHLTDCETVERVERRALGSDPSRLTSSQIRARARGAVAALDKDAAGRHQRARAERRVTLVPQDDGMAGLWALLPAEQAVAIHDRLTALGRDAADESDPRTAEQRRADVFTDLLLGAPHQRHVQVSLTMPLGTMLGGDEPAELAGYGPIDAHTARRLAQDATWRRILTDPTSGAVLDVGRTRYRPPAALAEHVTIRDRTCVFPGCARPAASCDLDHTVAWQDGGTTSADNLAPLCRHHHRLKHETDWQLSQPVPGGFRWTSPTGTKHHTGFIRTSGAPPPNS
jgi:hypothetical protein